MLKKIIKILLFSIAFLFILKSNTFAVWTLDKIYQPHLEVVPYNEVLESIKNNTLEPVSIFLDETLKRKWSNVMVSLWVIVLLVILFKIWISIVQGSQNNLKRDFTYLILLFFISSVFTPFFSFISQSIAWEEKFYKDYKTNIEYARVYLPTNTAFIVQNRYVDEKNRIHSYNEVFKKRKDVYSNATKWTEDYLGIPAKVVQTQWISKEGDPEKRFSKIFYSVSLDDLFKWMKWPIKELAWKDCKINIKYLIGKGEWAPMSFVDALWVWNTWKELWDDEKNREKVNVISKYTGEDLWKKEVINLKNCSVWLYLISTEFLEYQTLGYGKWNKKFSWEKFFTDLFYDSSETLRRSLLAWKDTSSLSELLFNNIKIKEIWPTLSYAQQKRLIYTEEAIHQLIRLSKNSNKKIKEDVEVKNTMLACGRIIMDNPQGNEDFRKCLRADVFWDTTVYTQEATRQIGLLWKNREINKGYILPVPQNQDWDGPLYYRVWRNLLSFFNLANYKKSKAPDKEEESKLWSSLKSIFETVTFANYRYWNKEYKGISTWLAFSRQEFLPQLASFEAYDLDWNGIDDREEWKNKTSKNIEDKYYSYYYGDTFWQDTFSTWDKNYVSIRNKNLNFLKSPVYKLEEKKDTFSNKKFFYSFWEDEEKSVVEKKDYKSISNSTYYINWKWILPIKGNYKKINSINGNYIYTIKNGYGSNIYLYNPITLKKTNVNFIINNSGTYKYFLWSGFNIPLTEDKNWDKKTLLKEKTGFKIKEIGYLVWEENWLDGEYLLKNGSSFIYCKDKNSFISYVSTKTGCETKSKIKDYTYDEYKNKNRKIEPFLIYKDNNWNYLVEKRKTVNDLKDYTKVFIPDLSTTYVSSHYIYNYYIFSKTKKWEEKLFSVPTNYRTVNGFVLSSLSELKSNELFNKGINAKLSSTVTLYKKNKTGELGRIEPVKIYVANFDKLGQEYPSKQARILLNSKYNPPLEYTPENEHYLPEYKQSKKMCLVNSDYSDKYKNLFDYIPWQSKNLLDKCSLIGNHMRLTDIRLITYVQNEAMFNISPESESFTHIHIPLLSNEYIREFTKDRRSQNYAWEASDKGGLIWSKRISWILVREGDVAVLKPWVVIWVYDYPVTLLIPKKVLPFLKFVSTDNPLKKKIPSKVFQGGVYSVITGLISFFKEGSISKHLIWSPIETSNEEKYGDFAKNKLSSRPLSLKETEGIVPDRYFTSYYWASYFGEADIWQWNSLISSISSFLLEFFNLFLKYRVEILKFIYIVGPLLVFTLLFEATRKIFSGMLALTIVLLLLPIIILFIVNLFYI